MVRDVVNTTSPVPKVRLCVPINVKLLFTFTTLLVARVKSAPLVLSIRHPAPASVRAPVPNASVWLIFNLAVLLSVIPPVKLLLPLKVNEPDPFTTSEKLPVPNVPEKVVVAFRPPVVKTGELLAVTLPLPVNEPQVKLKVAISNVPLIVAAPLMDVLATRVTVCPKLITTSSEALGVPTPPQVEDTFQLPDWEEVNTAAVNLFACRLKIKHSNTRFRKTGGAVLHLTK